MSKETAGLQLNKNGKPIQRRSADGCQNCKVARVKCDRRKPACGCCQRRGEECNYSRITFNGINSVKNDRRTGRKSLKTKQAELKAKQADMASTSPSTNCSRSPSVVTSPGSVSSYVTAPAQPVQASELGQFSGQSIFSAFVDKASIDSTCVVPTERRRSISIEQLLTANVSPRKGREASTSPASTSCDSQSSACSEAVSSSSSVTSVTSVVPVKLVHQRSLGGITSTLEQGAATLLGFPVAQHLLDHYIGRTVATLHPQQGACSLNGSTRWFLPIALHFPVVLESILALSGAQLCITQPNLHMVVLQFKTKSVTRLNQLMKEKPAEMEKPSCGYTLEILGAMLTFITLAVAETGTSGWQIHCDAARHAMKILSQPLEPRLAYVHIRLLKYVCFAEVARPSLADMPELDMIQGTQQDEAFGVPGLGLKLATMITRYAAKLRSGMTPAMLASDRIGLDLQFHDYINTIFIRQCASDENKQPSLEWQMVQEAWRLTIVLYYQRMLFSANFNDPLCVDTVSKIIDCMQFLSLSGHYGTALAFTMLTIAPLLRDGQTRTWFDDLLLALSKSTNTGNFLSIRALAQLCWSETDAGRCRTLAEVNLLAEQRELIVLAA